MAVLCAHTLPDAPLRGALHLGSTSSLRAILWKTLQSKTKMHFKLLLLGDTRTLNLFSTPVRQATVREKKCPHSPNAKQTPTFVFRSTLS